MNIGALVASLSIDPSGMREGVKALSDFEKKANAQLGVVDKRLKAVGTSMKDAGKLMSISLTTSIIGVGAASFALQKDFQASMSQIEGLVGESREQVNAWSKEVLEMAPRLGKAPKELADALFFVTSAGIKGSAAIDVLDKSAKAAASGLGETAVIADLVTSAMNAYGPAVMDATKTTDILVAAVREGKAEASALAPALGKILPTASEMGVSFDQVAAAVAGMTRTGTEATEATTQLRAIFNALLKPSQEANEQLALMGTSASELRKSLREKGLITTLSDLKTLTSQYGEEAMSKVIPSVEALGAVFNLVGSNAESNKAIFKSLTDATGSLDKAFLAASETSEFKYNQALASSKAAMIAIGDIAKDAIIPLFERLSKILQTLADWFTNLDSSQRSLVITFAAVTAAAGPMLYILGMLASSIIPTLITGVKTATKVVRGLTTVMAKNPIMAFVTVLMSAVVALNLFKDKTEEATAANDAFNKTIEEGKQLQEQISSIDAKVRAARNMDKRQLEALQDEILRQIELEKDHTAIIIGESKKRLETNAEYQKKVKEYQEAAKQVRLNGNDILARQEAAQLATQLTNLKESLLEEQVATYDASQERIKTLVKYGAEVIGIYKGIKKVTGEPITVSPISPVIVALQEDLKFIGKMEAAFGEAYDEIENKTKAYQKAIEAGLSLPGISENNKYIQSWVNQLKSLEEAQKAVEASKISKTVSEELAYAAASGALLGDSFDMLGEQAGIYESALQELIRLFPEGSAEISNYIKSLQDVKTAQDEAAKNQAIIAANKALQEQFTLIAAKSQLMGDEFNATEAQLQAVTAAWETMKAVGGVDYIAGLEEQWKILNEAVKAHQKEVQIAGEKAQQLQQIYDQIGNTLSNVFTIMGEGLAEGKIAWQEMGSAILSTLQQIITGLLAKAIAGMIAGESSKGLLGLATATIGIAALKGIFESQVKVPRAYNGATVYGDTLMRVGDYPGAQINPEIIAPLNDLKALLPNTAPGDGHIKVSDKGTFPDKVQLKVIGSDLYAVWEKEYKHRNRN